MSNLEDDSVIWRVNMSTLADWALIILTGLYVFVTFRIYQSSSKQTEAILKLQQTLDELTQVHGLKIIYVYSWVVARHEPCV
jgi:hypothetical protein